MGTEKGSLPSLFSHPVRGRIVDGPFPDHRLVAGTHLRVCPGESKLDKGVFIIAERALFALESVRYGLLRVC